MGNVVGNILSHGVAVAISPLPIVAVILILFTPKARSNSVAFLGGWLLGLIVVGTIVLLTGGFGSGRSGASGGSALSGIISLLLGLLLLVLAVRRWRTRPGKDEEPEMPRWMSAIDRFGPAKSVGMAAFLSGVNPKNLALTVATATTIAAAEVGAGRQVFGLAVFIVIGSITVATPVIFYQLLGQRAERGLNRMKDWLVANNNTVMMVLLIVFGVKLLGQGIGVLFG
ncbi:MAG: GAP family protein [Rubrobacteraceae bacterium]